MARSYLTAIQSCISNDLSDSAIGERAITGVLGDAPSQYSRSPKLWNAAFDYFKTNAVYLPFDIRDDALGRLITVLRQCERFWGANVTVPHKVRVMEFLDDIDPSAQRIGAVNTIVRTGAGRLIGYNTDGQGFLESILNCQPDRTESFVPSLEGIGVLLLGAGGSARAVALHTAAQLEGGTLLICNRTRDHAISLAVEVNKSGGRALDISEAQLAEYAPKVGLIINSTTKGQGGIRKSSDGRVTKLEPYSSLAPAHPPLFAESDFADRDFDRLWWNAARADVEFNNRASLQLAHSIPPHVRFYDLIYHPEETVFLRHGRITGHATMNGKAMIINQAAIAFANHICRADFQTRGLDSPEIHKKILQVMNRAW